MLNSGKHKTLRLKASLHYLSVRLNSPSPNSQNLPYFLLSRRVPSISIETFVPLYFPIGTTRKAIWESLSHSQLEEHREIVKLLSVNLSRTIRIPNHLVPVRASTLVTHLAKNFGYHRQCISPPRQRYHANNDFSQCRLRDYYATIRKVRVKPSTAPEHLGPARGVPPRKSSDPVCRQNQIVSLLVKSILQESSKNYYHCLLSLHLLISLNNRGYDRIAITLRRVTSICSALFEYNETTGDSGSSFLLI